MRSVGSRLWMVALCASAMLLARTVWAQSPGNATRAEQWDYKEIETAPAKARAKRNPYEGKSDALAAGRNLFEQHCAECHGETAFGGKKAPSLRAAEIQNEEPGALFWMLTNGVVRRGLQVWSKLAEPA